MTDDIPRNPADDRMREEVKGDELYVDPPKTARIHPWVYTIIPITNYNSRQWVFFTAYCKACRSYFTEEMPYNDDGKALLSKSTLPRYGCEPISDDVSLL